MDNEEGFLAAIRSEPTDSTARLVYADWLDERGDRRSEFLRATCQATSALRRLEELRSEFPADWINRVDLFPSALSLEPLNIVERYAFALACIERLCQSWAVTSPYLTRLIEAHWTLTTQRVLADSRNEYDWFDETREFAPDTPDELADRLGPGVLSVIQAQALHHAVDELRGLASEDMYASPQSYLSMGHTLNVIGILLRWGVEPPSLERFRKEGYPPGEFGYGTRRPARADFLGDCH